MIRNCYPILLIKEILTYIIRYKYLIKLDIITIFNKLYIYLDSEDLITFTTLFGVFKYYILPFSLTNRSISF